MVIFSITEGAFPHNDEKKCTALLIVTVIVAAGIGVLIKN